MGGRDRLVLGLVVVAVGCAVVSTTLHVRREFFPSAELPSRGPTVEVYIPDWEEYAKHGHRRGPAEAAVTLVEFADFECPACQEFAREALPAILKQYEGRVAHVFRHWPLPQHRFAYPTARAAECAGEQGRFAEFHDAIYAVPDSLGLIPFTRVAWAAGVPDTAAFARCNAMPGRVTRVDEDIAAAKKLGARGTPTILVNGRMLVGAPDSAALAEAVQKALTARAR